MSGSSADRVNSVDSALTSVIALLENEQTLKKAIREAVEPLEDVVRGATAELNKLHASASSFRLSFPIDQDVPAESSSDAGICEKCLGTITTAHPHWNNVAELIPAGEFHRYQYALGPIMRSFVTLIAMAHFMLTDSLATADKAAQLMGLERGGTESIQLAAEDYLQGVIGMVNELPRLSINSVTAQNFALPVKIAGFVNDIFASYSLLNLRNDALRRKFDGLKYDLKRCEDVLYDLTLRGLTPAPSSS